MPSAAVTGTVTASVDADDIVAGGKTLFVDLTDDTYVANVGSTLSHVSTDTKGTIASGGGTEPKSLPGSLSEGDLVIIAIVCDSPLSSDGVQSGQDWNVIHSGGENDPGLWIGYKVMGSTPDTTVTVLQNGSNGCAYLMQAFRGAHATSPLWTTSTAADGNSADANHPSISYEYPYAMLVCVAGLDDDDTTVNSYPSGFSNGNSQASGDGSTVAISSKLETVTTSPNPGDTAFASSDAWWAWTIALRPETPWSDAVSDIISGITSAQTETHGWNNEVRDNLVVSDLTRSTDTKLALSSIPAASAYDITSQETITVTIPGSALVGGSPIVASPTFTIDPTSVTASVTGVTATATAAGNAGVVTALPAALITGVTATATAVGLAGSVSTVRIVSISGAVATATAAGVAGSVTSVEIASVTGVTATATAVGLAGEVTVGKVVTGVTATATAAGLAGSVSTVNISNISGVTATATAAGLAGAVTSAQIASISGELATATAEGLAGVVTSIGIVSVSGVTATATAAGLAGAVTALRAATVAGELATATATGLAGTPAVQNFASVSGAIATAVAVGIAGEIVIMVLRPPAGSATVTAIPGGSATVTRPPQGSVTTSQPKQGGATVTQQPQAGSASVTRPPKGSARVL